MKREFLVALAPTDDFFGWVGQWRIRRPDADGPVPPEAAAQIFEDKRKALEWLEAAAAAQGFRAVLPESLESPAFVAVAAVEE